jgi:ribokinase
MSCILVSGLINIETTLRIESFPLHYNPVNYPFFGVNSTVSGVGYNLTKALAALGNEVRFLSLIGRDVAGQQVRAALAGDGLPADDVLTATHTAQSVILYEKSGRRQIHTDLKDIQELSYPPEAFGRALAQTDVCALCNINFSRPMLAAARAAGKLIATDVHALGSLDDDYNSDFMRVADILFMSHERLPAPPAQFAREVLARFGNEIVVIGMSGEGAVLAVKREGRVVHYPAVRTREVVNTIGAGDALFAAFLDGYACTRNADAALRRAMAFASWKIGATGAAEGFLSASELERLVSGLTG